MILAIGSLLALCAVAACVIGIGSLTAHRSDQGPINIAEQHFDSAMRHVGVATQSLKKVPRASQGVVKIAIADASQQLRSGRDEVAAAGAAAEQLKDSAGRTDYLDSLKAATATFDALQSLVGYLDTATGMVSKATQAAALAKSANKALSSAVKSGNAGDHSAMGGSAVSASANYAKAALLFREAEALDPAAGFDNAAAYCEDRKLQSDVVVRMADEGKAGKRGAYNSDVKRQAALSKQAESVGAPAILTDPDWLSNRLASLGNAVDAAAKQADDMRAQALKELGVTP